MRELSIKEKKRKCAKCGSSPADDPTVKLHRFPQPNKANKPRCELWAKFCFPDESWKSPQFQNKLFTEHKMLCDKHFKSTSFEKEKRLAKFSVPENNYNKVTEQDGPAELQGVFIKNEPCEVIVKQEHSESKMQQLKSLQKNGKINDLSKKRTNDEMNIQIPNQSSHKLTNIGFPKKSRPLKRRAEEIEDKDEPPKNNDKIWDMEDQDMSQDFDNAGNEWFSKTTNEQNDDCELYGKLLTRKLRTYAVYERNILMFKIDGLLIEHPPGFDTSLHSYSITSTDKTVASKSNKSINKVEMSSKKKINIASNNSYKPLSLSSQPKTKKLKDEHLSHSVKIRSNEETSSTSAQVTTMPLSSSIKQNNDVPKKVKVVSKSSDQPAKILSSIPKQPVKVINSMQHQQMKIISSIPNEPVKVISSIPNQPVKVTSITDQPIAPLDKSNSVPSNIPLKITIPQTKVVPVTQSKFVVSSSHPKGNIVVVKSKSAKYVPSSQPPILITLPTLHGHSQTSQCDMNSLEQLSSIAETHASRTQYERYEFEENEIVDDNDVSHEVILSTSDDVSSQNIVETALKYAKIT